jgi:cytochrome P450
LLFPHHCHFSEEFFKNPFTFDPERFQDSNGQEGYFPFGFGERKCLAQQFVFFEVKLILIQMLAKFKLSTSKKELKVISEGFLMKPKENKIEINVENLF